ncbi:MAG: acetoacetate decarboxylase family protein [Acidimicrobiales bacterium]
MFRFDPDSSYVMPAHFGPRPMDPRASGWYHDVTAMTVSFLTDRDHLARYLPEPFEVGEQARVSVVYARNRQVDWLAGHGYNMIAVNASAVFKGANDHETGEFTLVMWENLTDPILSGRELQGIPKIYADIPDHSIVAGEWRATASHFGHTIVDLSVSELRQPTDDEIEAGLDAQANSTPMGWRYLPGVSGFGRTTSEATAYPSENHFTSVQVGDGRIDWHRLSWEQNPTQFHIVNALAELPLLEYEPAVVTEGSTNLILFDDLPRGLS